MALLGAVDIGLNHTTHLPAIPARGAVTQPFKHPVTQHVQANRVIFILKLPVTSPNPIQINVACM